MRFKLLVMNLHGVSVTHAVGSSTGETICGRGIDLRLDHVDNRWYQGQEAHRIGCPECRSIVERST